MLKTETIKLKINQIFPKIRTTIKISLKTQFHKLKLQITIIKINIISLIFSNNQINFQFSVAL